MHLRCPVRARQTPARAALYCCTQHGCTLTELTLGLPEALPLTCWAGPLQVHGPQPLNHCSSADGAKLRHRSAASGMWKRDQLCLRLSASSYFLGLSKTWSRTKRHQRNALLAGGPSAAYGSARCACFALSCGARGPNRYSSCNQYSLSAKCPISAYAVESTPAPVLLKAFYIHGAEAGAIPGLRRALYPWRRHRPPPPQPSLPRLTCRSGRRCSSMSRLAPSPKWPLSSLCRDLRSSSTSQRRRSAPYRRAGDRENALARPVGRSAAHRGAHSGAQRHLHRLLTPARH